MSKWTEYTQKEALKDNDELMILDTDGKANKRTVMNKVWDYVVDKMTSAVIAKLDTKDKTVLGALNELNSNTQTLTFTGCKVHAKVGVTIIKDSIITGNVPDNIGYIPIVHGHSSSNSVTENIFFDGGSWRIFTNYEQDVTIRFYKCIK